MSKKRSAFTSRLIWWAVLACLLYWLITGELPSPREWVR